MREEEKKRSSLSSSLKRFFKKNKRWVYPALYIASAAIILSAVLWFQNSNDTDEFDYEATDISGKNHDEPAIEVNRSLETFSMPVTDPESAVIQKEFYDYDGKTKEQEAALVFYNNTYHPNTGIDIAMEDGKAFDVTAAMSGTVTNVLEDPVLGNVIEVEHDKGIVTQYQSVADMDVKTGDKVKKGQVIAKAGKSLYNEEAGTHVHFEIRKDATPVNPIDYVDKSLADLQEADLTKSEKEVGDSENTDIEDGEEEGDSSEESGTDEENAEKEESVDDSDEEDKDEEETDDDSAEEDSDEEAEDKESTDS